MKNQIIFVIVKNNGINVGLMHLLKGGILM